MNDYKVVDAGGDELIVEECSNGIGIEIYQRGMRTLAVCEVLLTKDQARELGVHLIAVADQTEPGQRAFELYHKARGSFGQWHNVSAEDRAAWTAVEASL